MPQKVHLKDGSIINFPDGMAPDAMQRVITEHESKPQVPISGGGEINYKEPEPWYTRWGHNISDFARGTGEGIAGIPDALVIADTAVRNVGNRISGQPELPYIAPVTEKYNAAVPAPYDKDVNETGAFIGPAALEAVATRGRSLFDPEGSAIRNIVRGTTQMAGRTAVDVGAGYAGGEVGGQIGEKVGGKEGKILGTLAGGVASAPVAAGVKNVGARTLVDAESPAILDAMNRTNERLSQLPATDARGPAVIPASMALVGSKGAGIAEDLTARGILSGGPAQRARYEQYRGIETSVRDAANQLRGADVNNPPVSTPITKETIGLGVQDMSGRATNVLTDRIRGIQNQLQVTANDHVDPAAFRDRMNGIIGDRDVDTRLRMQAQVMLDRFNSNADIPQSGIGPERPPTYSATRQLRANLGKEIPAEGGLDTFVQAPAYESLTDVMRTASNDPTAFDFGQAETARLADLRRGLRRPSRAENEGSAYNAVFGGEGKNSIQQLAGFQEATPDQLSQLLADNMELRFRGPENAGRAPQPETFKPQLLKQWQMMSPDARRAYTGGNLDLEHQLDDAARLSRADIVRPGKRSSPGETGSTIGATMQLGTAGGLGGILGALNNVGGEGNTAMSTLLGAAALPPLAAAVNYGTGRLLTSPRSVNAAVNPVPVRSLDTLSATLPTTGIGSNIVQGQLSAQEKQARDLEWLKKVIENGGVEP